MRKYLGQINFDTFEIEAKNQAEALHLVHSMSSKDYLAKGKPVVFITAIPYKNGKKPSAAFFSC